MTKPVANWRTPLAFIACSMLISVVFAKNPGQKRYRAKKAPPKHTVHTPAKPAPAKAAGSTVSPALIEAIRSNNTGVAFMYAHRFPEAYSRFQTACIMLPDSDTGCLNSGIALLAMQQYDDAHRILATSAQRDPKSARAWYNLGLLDSAENQPAAALNDFQQAASLAPDDADTQCFIGIAYMDERQYSSAFAAFQNALKIDPLNATAESGATEALAQMGKAQRQPGANQAENEITGLGLRQPFGDNYGEQGKYSLAAEVPPPTAVARAIPVHFTDVTHESGLMPPQPRPAPARRTGTRSRATAKPAAQFEARSAAEFLGGGACVFDYDGDGRPDIFLVDADGKGDAALYRNLGGGHFADVTKAAKLSFRGEGMGCAVGDYDNDGHPDLAISFNGGVRLFHNTGRGTFSDVTASSGIRVEGLAMGLSFVDYDGDGNLDLYVTRFRDFPIKNPSEPFTWPDTPGPGNMLWRNNGNGTFSDVTASLAARESAPSIEAIATDLTNDGAVDFLLTGLRSVPALLMNTAQGAFKPASWWGAETQGPAAGGVSFDFDKDGYMDVALTHWQPTTLGLWRNFNGKSFERVALPDPGWMRAWGISTLDYDNDGWIDLVAVGETFSGEGRIVLLRNEGGKGFHDVTSETGLDKIALHDPRSVVAFDAQGDGGVDLLITQNHRPPVLVKAVGSDKHQWTQITLRGDTANVMGLGVNLQMFSGALRQKFQMPVASGYLSQGPAVISAGLGDEGEADAVVVRWGREPQAFQVQMPVAADRKTLISQPLAAKTQ
jgi:tetratricopeptide (TPR) repeat protein